MKGFGDRLRARGKELGLSDTEVAHRLGLRQTRYSNYVNNEREPDLATLSKICKVLGISADELLGLASSDRAGPPDDVIEQRIQVALRAIRPETREMIAAMLDAVVDLQQRTAPPKK